MSNMSIYQFTNELENFRKLHVFFCKCFDFNILYLNYDQNKYLIDLWYFEFTLSDQQPFEIMSWNNGWNQNPYGGNNFRGGGAGRAGGMRGAGGFGAAGQITE